MLDYYFTGVNLLEDKKKKNEEVSHISRDNSKGKDFELVACLAYGKNEKRGGTGEENRIRDRVRSLRTSWAFV